MSIKSIFGLAFLFVAFLVMTSSVFIVNEVEQVLVTQFGDPRRTETKPGLYFKTPFVQDVMRLERRLLSLDAQEQEVITSDRSRLVIRSFARYRISDPLKAYQSARNEIAREALLERILNSSLLQVIAENTMEAVVSGDRAVIMRRISDITNEKAGAVGLEVADIRLKRVEVPKGNRDKIFQQMKTERERLAREERAKGQSAAVTIRAGADRTAAEIIANATRKSSIIRGEADAYGVKVFAEAFGKDVEFFEFYRTMQTYKKALGNSDTRLILSPDSEFFNLLMNGGYKKKKR